MYSMDRMDCMDRMDTLLFSELFIQVRVFLYESSFYRHTHASSSILFLSVSDVMIVRINHP
ncbi:MAG: hypothetical protein NVSMB44_33680 [Ktedonobacteraceae bacterium]